MRWCLDRSVVFPSTFGLVIFGLSFILSWFRRVTPESAVAGVRFEGRYC